MGWVTTTVTDPHRRHDDAGIAAERLRALLKSRKEQK